MARDELLREDLLRDAQALTDRAEYRLPAWDFSVVLGFRPNGAGSIFVGEDPAYHWNSAGELRRAYVGGLLYKAERGNLVELKRQRSAERVVLVSRTISAAEQAAFLMTATQRLTELAHQLRLPQTVCVGEVTTAQGSLLPRVLEWLESLQGPLCVAQTPRVS